MWCGDVGRRARWPLGSWSHPSPHRPGRLSSSLLVPSPARRLEAAFVSRHCSRNGGRGTSPTCGPRSAGLADAAQPANPRCTHLPDTSGPTLFVTRPTLPENARCPGFLGKLGRGAREWPLQLTLLSQKLSAWSFGRCSEHAPSSESFQPGGRRPVTGNADIRSSTRERPVLRGQVRRDRELGGPGSKPQSDGLEPSLRVPEPWFPHP